LRRHALGAAVAVSLCLVSTAVAGATIPTGNLLRNPGAEDGPAAHRDSEFFTPPGWVLEPAYPPPFQSQLTTIYYGATGGFPTIEQGIALGGGHAFFAGGPPQPPGTPDEHGAAMDQEIPLPPEAFADIDAGSVQATGGGCLGGYADQDDNVRLAGVFRDSGGFALDTVIDLLGPDANGRGGQTKLLPVSGTVMVPAGTRFLWVRVFFNRAGIERGYVDAYADNLLMALSRAGSTPPQPTCSVARAPSPGPAPGPGPGPKVPQLRIARGSSKATLRSGRVGVSLKCTSPRRVPCKGSVRLSVPSLTLGSKRFTIAAGKTTTVKVPLGRRWRARLKHMSTKRLRQLEVTARVRVGSASTKFALRLRR
jgi:hypothetical protein